MTKGSSGFGEERRDTDSSHLATRVLGGGQMSYYFPQAELKLG
jgi:hypothetical protein